MENIEITRVTWHHAAILREIGRQTFIETFSEVNTPQNMRKYLEERFSIERLTGELKNEESEFYLATAGNKVAGYLKLNSGKSQTELQDNKALEIERIYVLKEYHGKKVGQALYDKALQIAIYKNAEFIWLGVWENNLRALSFYKKNGFVIFDKHIFVLGDSRQTDYLMKFNIPQINQV